MGKSRKESRQFNISVEGINCERMYFEHLANLINQSQVNQYHAKINCKKISPEQFAKRNAYLPIEKNYGITYKLGYTNFTFEIKIRLPQSHWL